jgi:hypothetical protein
VAAVTVFWLSQPSVCLYSVNFAGGAEFFFVKEKVVIEKFSNRKI